MKCLLKRYVFKYFLNIEVQFLVCLKLISIVLSKSITDFSKLWGMCWFSGNRGWRLEIWNSTKTLNFNDLDEIAAMNDTLEGYNVSYIEEAKYVYSNQKHVARLSGYFVAPDSGKFAFFIKGKYTAKMYFTTQNNRVCLTLILRYLWLYTGYVKCWRQIHFSVNILFQTTDMIIDIYF